MNDNFCQGPRGPARQGGSPWGICTPSDHKNPVSKAFRVVSRPLTGSRAWKAAMHVAHMFLENCPRSAGRMLAYLQPDRTSTQGPVVGAGQPGALQ